MEDSIAEKIAKLVDITDEMLEVVLRESEKQKAIL